MFVTGRVMMRFRRDSQQRAWVIFASIVWRNGVRYSRTKDSSRSKTKVRLFFSSRVTVYIRRKQSVATQHP